MPDISASFAKIVATPTLTSWSQAYNLGSLFVAISLTNPDITDPHHLPALGKDILDQLEQNFSALEEKNLEVIKKTIIATISAFSDDIILSLVIGYLKQNVLYLCIAGGGSALLKRDTSSAALLMQPEKGLLPLSEQAASLHTVSGFLKAQDTLVLQTQPFTRIIPLETLKQALELPFPNDSAEYLTPHVHDKEEGGAAAIILTFHNAAQMEEPLSGEQPLSEETEQESDPSLAEAAEQENVPTQPAAVPHRPLFTQVRVLFKKLPLSPIKLAALCFVILLSGILLWSIFLGKKSASSSVPFSNDSHFTAVYQEAEQAYEQGQKLDSLNQSLAQDSYQKAAQILENAQGSFTNPQEKQQISTLLQKVKSHLSGASAASVQKVTLDKSPYLSVLSKHSGALASTQDETSVYLLTSSAILQAKLSGAQPSPLITNNNDWQTGTGLAVYNNNLYLLDPQKGVLKYVAGDSGYSKSAYFSGAAPDLSRATTLAIDGSVWIGFQDGTIKKYTKGEEQPFTLSGATAPLSGLSLLETTSEMTNLYALSSSQGQLTVIGKDGTVGHTFTATPLKEATAMDIHEQDGIIYFLSGGALYALSLH